MAHDHVYKPQEWWVYFGVGKSGKPEDHRLMECACGDSYVATRPHVHSFVKGRCMGCGERG